MITIYLSYPSIVAGVSIASDFMPLVNSTRSRMLELNVEYRDTMIQLKVIDDNVTECWMKMTFIIGA